MPDFAPLDFTIGKPPEPMIEGVDPLHQLMQWQARGYYPQLHSAPGNTWVLILETDPWFDREDISMKSEKKKLRFVTDRESTPWDAIRSAMEVIR